MAAASVGRCVACGLCTNGKEREGVMSKIWTENGGLRIVRVRQPRRHHYRLDTVKRLVLVVVIAVA